MATALDRPFRPLDAFRSLRALVHDPDDTGQVFKVIEALSGNTGARIYQRFLASPMGARILTERRVLLDTLADARGLRALPEGSLGRAYLDFITAENITPGGLLYASQEAPRPDLPWGRRLFADRTRDMHDLWHVVTGYGPDLLGESALLSFTLAQTMNPGVGLIVAVAFFKATGEAAHGKRLIIDAFRRGQRAAWLPSEDWEGLLALPLDEVRAHLALGEPPAYRQIFSPGSPRRANAPLMHAS